MKSWFSRLFCMLLRKDTPDFPISQIFLSLLHISFRFSSSLTPIKRDVGLASAVFLSPSSVFILSLFSLSLHHALSYISSGDLCSGFFLPVVLLTSCSLILCPFLLAIPFIAAFCPQKHFSLYFVRLPSSSMSSVYRSYRRVLPQTLVCAVGEVLVWCLLLDHASGSHFMQLLVDSHNFPKLLQNFIAGFPFP